MINSLVSFFRDLFGAVAFGVLWVFDYARRLWVFWGPRLCDRNFVGMICVNAAGLLALDPAKLGPLEIAIWLGANLFFRTWDNLPDERLQPAGVLPAGGPGSRYGAR